MKDTFFGIALFVLSCIFISCKNHENVATEIPKVTLSEGLYVNQSLLEMIVDTTLLWDIRRLGEQITILKGDTIEVDNFIEKEGFILVIRMILLLVLIHYYMERSFLSILKALQNCTLLIH